MNDTGEFDKVVSHLNSVFILNYSLENATMNVQGYFCPKMVTEDYRNTIFRREVTPYCICV